MASICTNYYRANTNRMVSDKIQALLTGMALETIAI